MLRPWRKSFAKTFRCVGAVASVRSYHPALAAGLSLLLTSPALPVQAQGVPDGNTARLKYVYYRDFQNGTEDRMKVSSPMLWVHGPIGESYEYEASATLDSLSGASPLYLDTLSGASGKGVEDIRRAGDIKITKYFESFAVGVGGGISDEDDYRSETLTVDGRYWTPDKNTTFAVGFATDWDRLTSSNNPDLDEDRRTRHYLVGVTQVINPVSIVQFNLTHANGRGYFNDPYKLFENRPRSREEWAFLTRYNYFLESLDASVHADYRIFFNTWGVTSHTLALRYYQPVSAALTIVPMFRYYTQDRADFFLNEIPPESFEQFNSADERLSSFGGVSAGMKFVYQVSDRFELDLLYEHTVQSSNLHLGGGSDTFERFGAHYLEAGMAVRF